MRDIFEEKAKIWNSRLKQCLENKGYKQTEFADKLNEYNKQPEKSITQETVSRWVHVGDRKRKRDEKGKDFIGFPNYENMVCIAKCLDVDLGYLTGETDAETFTLEQASELLNLDAEALKVIIKITGKEKTCLNFGYESENYRKILNDILTSKKFLDIIKTMFELDNIYTQNKKKNTKLQDLQKELGDELFDKAMNMYRSNNIDENLTQEECNAIAKIDCSIDNDRKKDYDFQREIAFNRFKLQEDFILLLNELYPDMK